MEKEITKQKRFRIVIDDDTRGLGYSRIKGDTCYMHVIGLFIFMICFTTPRRKQKRQVAKYLMANCVQIGDKTLPIKYYASIEQLTKIYFRNSLNAIIKAYKFHQIEEDKYALYDETQGKWIVLYDIDVYIFKPDAQIEGFVENGVFYGIKELSIG